MSLPYLLHAAKLLCTVNLQQKLMLFSLLQLKCRDRQCNGSKWVKHNSSIFFFCCVGLYFYPKVDFRDRFLLRRQRKNWPYNFRFNRWNFLRPFSYNHSLNKETGPGGINSTSHNPLNRKREEKTAPKLSLMFDPIISTSKCRTFSSLIPW